MNWFGLRNWVSRRAFRGCIQAGKKPRRVAGELLDCPQEERMAVFEQVTQPVAIPKRPCDICHFSQNAKENRNGGRIFGELLGLQTMPDPHNPVATLNRAQKLRAI